MGFEGNKVISMVDNAQEVEANRSIESVEDLQNEILELVVLFDKLKVGVGEAFHDLYQKDFRNILAAKFHGEVLNGGIRKDDAMIMFKTITERVDEHNKSNEKEVAYDKLSKDYEYLIK
jgi:hypothetical protein